MLGLVLGSVIVKGASPLSLDFFTQPRGLFGEAGGMADAIVGSLIIVSIATLIAVPIGVLVAIYLSEFASKSVAIFVRIVLDVMNGIPAIVVGIFVFGVIVVGRGQSASRGRVRALDPDGADGRSCHAGGTRARSGRTARGEPRARCQRWRTVLGVVLPTALGGIVTGSCSPSRVSPARRRRSSSRRRSRRTRSTRRDPGAADAPGCDLHLLGVARPGRAGARLDGGARPDQLRARDEHAREGRSRARSAAPELTRPSYA